MFEKKTDNITIILAVGLIIIALGLVISSAKENRNEQDNTISVSGSNEMTVMPDQAKIYVRVVTLQKTALESQQENTKISNKVISALKEQGVIDADIQTKGYNLYQKTDYIYH